MADEVIHCANKQCDCTEVKEEGDYCSPECETAENDGIFDYLCHCEHRECSKSI